MAISAGRLTQMISVLNPVLTRNAAGEMTEEWVSCGKIHADIRGRSSRERMQSGAEMAQAEIRIWVRGQSGREITAASRLHVLSGPWRDRILNVVGLPVPGCDRRASGNSLSAGRGKMIETLLDFSGLEDISRDLQLLSGAENNRVLREATRAGANVLKEEVVSRAPVRRGKLRRNVVILSRRSRDGGMESGVHIRGVNPDTGNSDNTMKADNPRNAFYWRFVEMGTVNMPPHPFVRPAFDVRSEQAAQVAIARMNRAIDEVLRR